MEFKDSPEYKEMQAKIDAMSKSNKDNEAFISKLKGTIEEIKTDRDGLKTQLKEAKSQKGEENSTLEEMKKLLAAANEKADKAEKDKNLSILKSLTDASLIKAGFVTGESGQINRKLADSLVNYENLTHENGTVFGFDSVVEQLKNDHGYAFQKSNKKMIETEKDPKSFKGVDISSKGFAKATTMQQRMDIMRKREEKHKQDNKGMLNGMGNVQVEPITE